MHSILNSLLASFIHLIEHTLSAFDFLTTAAGATQKTKSTHALLFSFFSAFDDCFDVSHRFFLI